MVWLLIFEGIKFSWISLGVLSISFYMHGLGYNICSAWFLDIRIYQLVVNGVVVIKALCQLATGIKSKSAMTLRQSLVYFLFHVPIFSKTDVGGR